MAKGPGDVPRGLLSTTFSLAAGVKLLRQGYLLVGLELGGFGA
jgi:hypothetical protein